jgi:hypothetical protein
MQIIIPPNQMMFVTIERVSVWVVPNGIAWGFQCASTQPDSSKDRIVMYVDVKDYGAVGDGIADDIGL